MYIRNRHTSQWNHKNNYYLIYLFIHSLKITKTLILISLVFLYEAQTTFYAVKNPSVVCSDRKCYILYIHVLIIIAIGVVFYPTATWKYWLVYESLVISHKLNIALKQMWWIHVVHYPMSDLLKSITWINAIVFAIKHKSAETKILSWHKFTQAKHLPPS